MAGIAMSEQRNEFHKWMDEGHNAAWEQNWSAAINAYSRAIQVLPEDPDAHVNLGLALLNAGQLDRALKAFKKASFIAPEDPVPLERTADVLERMGQLKEAAQQYIKVAEAYLAQKDWDKAIGNWERATQLTPGLVSVHARLAQAYERLGDNKQAIREYLTLAFNFRRLNDVEKAIKAVERALRLDKNNAQALNTLRALKSGGEVILPDEMINRKRAPQTAAPVATRDPFSLDDDGEGEADPLGPIGEALSLGMGLLAAHVVESGLTPFITHALQGMEFQRQGLQKEAVKAYLEADKAGLRHPALKMNLGGLMVLTEQPEDAIKHLGEATLHPQLASGALHAVGLAYFRLGEQRKAAQYLVKSLQAVDTSLAVSDNEVQELANVYERLTLALEGRNNESLTAINERFTALLSGKDWKTRIAETRRHLEETLRGWWISWLRMMAISWQRWSVPLTVISSAACSRWQWMKHIAPSKKRPFICRCMSVWQKS
jgi:tetratricopeptide (TPR) repeat protein